MGSSLIMPSRAESSLRPSAQRMPRCCLARRPIYSLGRRLQFVETLGQSVPLLGDEVGDVLDVQQFCFAESSQRRTAQAKLQRAACLLLAARIMIWVPLQAN